MGGNSSAAVVAAKGNPMTIATRDENSASGALCELLRHSTIALKIFWNLARPVGGPVDLPPAVHIDHRHKTDQLREIDILLHSVAFGVIVECKVGDEKKPYQFDAYVAYWRRTRQTTPHLVWLLERDRPVLGDKRFPVVTITWAALRAALLQAADGASIREEGKIREFCTALVKAGIGKSESASPRPLRVAKGYEPDHAERILTSILAECPGVVGAPMTINALSPAIHAGRPEWEEILDDEWVRRVWLYLSPLDKSVRGKSAYHFHAQVLLYHKGFGDKQAAAISHIPRWAESLRKDGMTLHRNRSGTWNHGQELLRGEGVSPGVFHIFAEESLQEAQERFAFDWRSDAAAVAAGRAHLMFYVDKFNRLTAL